MRAIAGFLIRLVAYAFVLGVASRVAEYFWLRAGLDGALALQSAHDDALLIMVIAPIGLAVVGIGPLRPVAIFAAAFLAGAVLTAPFALARFAGT